MARRSDAAEPTGPAAVLDAHHSAARSPLLAKIRSLVDFVGDGRKLTQTGNVTLADARQLVTLLDTGDAVDEQIGDRVFKTTSAAELPMLGLVLRVAKKARFVRTAKGRLLATKVGRAVGRDPLADLDRLVAAIDEVGMCSARYADGRYIWTSLAPFFDELFVPLTIRLITDTGPVPFDELVEHAFASFEEEIELDGSHWTESNRRRFVESEISTAVEVLEAAGIVTWDRELETSPYGSEKRTRGTVAATSAGRWALPRYLTATHRVPLGVARPAEHTGADFETLIGACALADADDVAHLMRELTAWVDHRGEERRH
jgi:hypothetical protein